MKPITIVGGGLAGLTLGIGLRRSGIPVTVWEAGKYPRHRVCGEFISGRGQDALTRLGLREQLVEAGAIEARTAVFFLGNAQSPVRPLPAAALCLSRFDLDAMLARHFCRLGGELRQERWRKEGAGESVVWANGRRPQTREGGWRWFGLKVHARNVTSLADLEMHGSPNGYVGITRLLDGEVNVCGLFRRPAAAREAHLDTTTHRERLDNRNAGFIRQRDEPHAPLPDKSGVPVVVSRCTPANEAAPAWADQLRGATGSPLHSRLAAAVFDETSSCSVAGLSLRPQRASDRAECCIGDALTMIPPVTGNGMSMAFESAELAIEPLADYGRGEISWTRAQHAVARSCDQAFGKRLRWARWLQWMMFTPALQHGLAPLALNSEMLWRVMFAKTR